MAFVKQFLRVVIFLLALTAVGMLVLGGGWYVLSQLGSEEGGAKITVKTMRDVAVGLYLKMQAEDINTPVSDDPTPVTFVVNEGDTATSVAVRLQQMGLINDATLFSLLIRHRGADQQIEAGEYELRANMTMDEIIVALQHAPVQEEIVRIPEGWRAEQIAELLTAQGVVDGQEFLTLVRSGVSSVDYDFLLRRPPGSPSSLEGFLYPDTYRIPRKATAADLIDIVLRTFDQNVTADMRQQATERGLTMYEVVTVASIVEREAVLAEERPLIASVYFNRLAQGMHLQADPTVQYALGYQPLTGQWWKTPVTLEEYEKVDSPYNTYLYPGLPPGPICNPSLDSIRAALAPAETNYLFFIAKGDGSHAFATTYEEHLRNQELYQR